MTLDLSCNAARTRASLRFAHPKGNIITAALVGELRKALAGLAEERHLRLLTIEGAGDDFSFGASVPEHARDQIGTVLPDMHALVVELLELPIPTAAVVRGRCLGGGFELALCCDFIFAADDAVFGLPEIALGVFPPVGSVLLPRRAGFGRATSTALTGVPRSAAEWQQAGLIELIAPTNALAAEIDIWFDRTLGRLSAEALRHAVRAIRTPLMDVVRRELPAIERLYLGDVMRSHDASEGIQAFLDKRPPEWRDE